MDMKTLLAAVLAISTVSAFAQNYTVDSSASKVTYVGKKVTGEHTGNLSMKEGTITLKGEEITAGNIVVDMNTLTSNDITDKEYNAKYVGHLKSPDFFDTAKYPTSTLKINSSKKTAKGLEVKGDLTMIGQTKPITFVVTDLKKTDKNVTGKTTMTLNRTNWGLKYGSNNFFKGLGDKAIHDDFTLSVDLSASAK
jgi:polyisoprenoid-binding protein YceI